MDNANLILEKMKQSALNRCRNVVELFSSLAIFALLLSLLGENSLS